MEQVTNSDICESIEAMHQQPAVRTTAKGWLQEHMETFVKPVLGTIPALSKEYRAYFSPEERTILKNMWRAVKRETIRQGKPLLLAGRDVFIFEVLARRENFPTVFRPDISRSTAPFVKEDYSKHFLFDTGFAGTIPRHLKCESFVLGSSNKAENLSNTGFLWARLAGRKRHTILREDTKQVFPRMKGARSLILKIERTPKYWRRGFYRDGALCVCSAGFKPSFSNPDMCYWCGRWKELLPNAQIFGILQEFSNPHEFLAAALLTLEIYTDSSPRFLPTPVEVKEHVVAKNYTYGSD